MLQLQLQLQLHYTDYIYIYYTTLHYTTLHCTTLHYTTTLLYTTVRYTPVHYTTLHYTTLHYTRLHYSAQHYSTPHYTTFHVTTLMKPHHNYSCNYNYTTLITLPYSYNSTTLQLQLTAALQHATSSSCGWGDHCNHCKHSKQHNSNHLSVHQWIRPAIHASQQLTSPIVSYTWNFRHCLAWYYW